MASQDGGWGDGGDSLFEGMVLFAPSPSPSADPAVEAPESPKPPTPRPAAATADADADTSATSQPLDEDLFSDLTLLDPQPALDQEQHPQGQDQNHRPASPVSPAPAAVLTRQPSSSALRKKKRAVRIGYGRSPQTAAPALPPQNPRDAPYIGGARL